MKVWIVETSGRYEDSWYVDSVYASRELADEAANRYQVERDVCATVTSREVLEELEPFDYPEKVQVWHTSWKSLAEGFLDVVVSSEFEGTYEEFEEGLEYAQASGTDRERVIGWALRCGAQAPVFINGGRSEFEVRERMSL